MMIQLMIEIQAQNYVIQKNKHENYGSQPLTEIFQETVLCLEVIHLMENYGIYQKSFKKVY